MKLSLLASAALMLSSSVAMAAEAPVAPVPAKPEVEAATKPATADYTILKLNNQDIKESEIQELWKGLFPGNGAPDFATFDESVRQNVLRGVISERLLYNEAVKAGYDKNAEVQKRLANLQRQVIMQAYIEDKSKSLVSDETLRKSYDAKAAELKAANTEELRARHILVKTEEEAKELEKQLKKGGDFEKLAKEKSVDKASGAQGGDLGYFTKERMVPAFSEAAFKMKKGDISAPVKSDFGWHIIKVEDRRQASLPSFEEMKEQLRAEVQQKAVQDYVEGLLKTADIKYFDAKGQEKEFSRSFEAPPAETEAPSAAAKPAAAQPSTAQPVAAQPATTAPAR